MKKRFFKCEKCNATVEVMSTKKDDEIRCPLCNGFVKKLNCDIWIRK